jgi:hypothetical protein
MAMRLSWAILFFILMGSGAYGQPNPAMANRLHIKFSGNVPHPVSNKAFKRSFTGIYDLNLAFKVRLFSSFSAGIQAKHVQWKVPDNKIPGLKTQGQFNGLGLCLSYDHAIGENAVLYAALTAGQAEMHFYDVSYDSLPENYQTNYRLNYGEFEVGAYFYTEGSFAIGFQSSIIFTNFEFDPYKLALDNHKAYIASDLEGSMSQFNLGFCVVYSFLKKKGT